MPTRNNRQSLIISLAPVVDGLVVALTGWLAYFTRWDKWAMPLDYASVLILATGLVLIILPASGAYNSWRGEIHWRHTSKALPGLLTVAALLMLAGTLSKTTAYFSRLWMGYWFVYALTALFLFRGVFISIVNLLQSGQSRSTRVLIVGEGDFARSVAQRAQDSQNENWEITGIISPFGASRQTADGTTATQTLDEMEALIFDPDSAIDEVWIAMDHTALDRQEAVIRVLQSSSLTVRYVPDLSMLSLLNHVPSEVAGMTVIDLNASPLTGLNTLIKAAFDTLFSAVTLILLSPFLALIALCIKLDSPGPVFFKQQRHGWDGKVIQVMKFRTMHHNQPATQDFLQAHRDDPRVTRIGCFLRRTSLDELPQFINVLRQEMSVVGPRPHPVALNKSYVSRIDAYMQRHRVKPGITGWAQVHGLRGETDTLEKMQRRVEYDLYYIEHWSLWLDIRVIARTLFRGWTGSNAY